MLGEFLEISIHTEDILGSIAFYETLGFKQARVGEIWSHPYAVLSDGRLMLGLHRYAFPSPALTFVLPDLLHRARDFEMTGIEFEFLKLGGHEFNEAGFYSPEGQMITLLEARTFSPPATQAGDRSLCGLFSDYRLGTADIDAGRDFWVSLGMISSEIEGGSQVTRLGMNRLNVTLYESAVPVPPALTFTVADLAMASAALEQAGLRPRAWHGTRASVILQSPEGMQLVIEEASG